MLENRKKFEALAQGVSLGLAGLFRKISRVTCPCCGYPTLDARGHYDICPLCNWEDEGADDEDADDAGGPNHGYTLNAARANFRQYGIMYTPDNNPTLTGGDSAERKRLKQALMAAYDAMLAASSRDLAGLWRRALRIEQGLDRELAQRIREYEKSIASREAR